jgi:hypothetical protein
MACETVVLMGHKMRCGVLAAMVLAIAGCAPSQRSGADVQSAIAEVNARKNLFPDYPQPDMTYLSFSKAHGYQVNYLAPEGRARLWYPGNRRGVPEEYKCDIVNGIDAICWRHPSGNSNPVTRTQGGGFQCSRLDQTQRSIVAALPGDPYALASGQVPRKLDRCAAPGEFEFDRDQFSC